MLGSGELVEATAEVNPDLFWALKGMYPTHHFHLHLYIRLPAPF